MPIQIMSGKERFGVGQPFEPGFGDAEGGEEVVDRAEIRLRHPAPQEVDDDEAGRPGQQQQPPGEGASTEPAVEADARNSETIVVTPTTPTVQTMVRTSARGTAPTKTGRRSCRAHERP